MKQALLGRELEFKGHVSRKQKFEVAIKMAFGRIVEYSQINLEKGQSVNWLHQ